MNNRFINCFIILTIFCFFDQNSNAGENSQQYRYYITWRNYSFGSPSEKAIYIWNGKEVGVGKKGFRLILKNLKEIPNGSRVYIFPQIATWRYKGGLPNPTNIYPFSGWWSDLNVIVDDKKIDFIFTDVNERGQFVKGL